MNLMTTKSFSNYTSGMQTNEIEKGFGNRPTLDPFFADQGDIVRIPFYPLDVRTLVEVSEYSDTVSIIKKVLKDELFRHGYDIKEKFAKKCESCGKMFKNPVDKCDNEDCSDPYNLREPDKKQKNRLASFINKCNMNDQDLTAIRKEVEDDLDT